jgi:hypothetical protein
MQQGGAIDSGCTDIIEFIGCKIRPLISPSAYLVNSPESWPATGIERPTMIASLVLHK